MKLWPQVTTNSLLIDGLGEGAYERGCMLVLSEMRASSRVCQYPRQPPPGTSHTEPGTSHTEKHSGDAYQSQLSLRLAKGGGEGEGQTAAQMHDLELKVAQPPRASTCHVKLSENPYIQ